MARPTLAAALLAALLLPPAAKAQSPGGGARPAILKASGRMTLHCVISDSTYIKVLEGDSSQLRARLGDGRATLRHARLRADSRHPLVVEVGTPRPAAVRLSRGASLRCQQPLLGHGSRATARQGAELLAPADSGADIRLALRSGAFAEITGAPRRVEAKVGSGARLRATGARAATAHVAVRHGGFATFDAATRITGTVGTWGELKTRGGAAVGGVKARLWGKITATDGEQL